MKTHELKPIEWETPAKCVVDMYRTAIFQHLMSQMDKVLTEETDDARAQAR